MYFTTVPAKFVLQSREAEFVSFSDCAWGTLAPGINGIGPDLILMSRAVARSQTLKGPRGCG
jgi:hypothetical protein